jgi:hypothetical protein
VNLLFEGPNPFFSTYNPLALILALPGNNAVYHFQGVAFSFCVTPETGTSYKITMQADAVNVKTFINQNHAFPLNNFMRTGLAAPLSLIPPS